MALRDKLREVRRKAGKDVDRGRDRAKRKAEELRRKAAKDARRGREVAKEKAAESLKDAAENAKTAAREELEGAKPDAEDKDIADRAREAGEARAPMDAQLDPGGDPREIESFASAGMGGDDGDWFAADEGGFFDGETDDGFGFFESGDNDPFGLAGDGESDDSGDPFGLGASGDGFWGDKE